MLPLQGALIFVYHYLFTHHALMKIDPHHFSSWLVLWLGIDFLYYWFHRATHRCNFLWVGHSVHHQSDHYNLSVALRQGIVQTLSGWIFYLPLAWIGFPTWMFLTVSSLNLIYQFWIHTTLIHRLRGFEIIFNSPSHHRVHHGTNPQYIDKNYAGSLIIWDKLFGTFVREEEPVKYGTTDPLASWNPFYANIQVLCDTFQYGKGLSAVRERIQAFLMPPEWILTKLGNKQNDLPKRLPLAEISPQAPILYIFVNLTVIILCYGYYFAYANPSTVKGWLLFAFILASLYAIGKILNKESFVLMPYIESLRWFLLLIWLHLQFQSYWFDITAFAILLSLHSYLHYHYTFAKQLSFPPIQEIQKK
ncbi:MAG: sterol desaturase family protein [Legionella sp.]|nr:sterol desaturase family protein [Legionella sp.]